MYITAMLLRSPRRERGVNVYVHLHPDGLPVDRQRLPNDPGPEAREYRIESLPPGGNDVEAYVDLALKDEDYDLPLVIEALRYMAKHISASTTNQVNLDYPTDQSPLVSVRFWVTNMFADPETKRDVYGLLRKPIEGLLQKRIPTLPPLASRQQAQSTGV
jgi:hypothetical protein